MLDNFFTDITVAVNGQDGFDTFKEHKFDIVLSDINIPKFNGLELLRKIKEIDENILFLLLSAHNESEYLLESIEQSVDGYILKPFDSVDFTTALEKVVNKISLRKDKENIPNQPLDSKALYEVKNKNQDAIYPFTILFVEDEKGIRDTYVEYLKMLFSEVYEAADGEEAYEIYKQKKPQIMIIDIHMPKMNGIELLSKIRETDHSTKAIMLTAHTDTTLLLEASSLKLTKYLVKPISRSDLKEALKLVIKELTSFST